MKKIISFLFVIMTCFCLTGCNNSEVIKEIEYSDLEKMIDNKDSFILEIVHTGCRHCEEFSPRFRTVLKNNNVTAYSLNLYNLSDDDMKKFNDLTTSVSGTPTVLYFEDGKETSNRIYGAVDNEKVEDFLEKIDK